MKRGRSVNRLKAVSSVMSFYRKDTTILATLQVLYELRMRPGVNDSSRWKSKVWRLWIPHSFPQFLSNLFLRQKGFQHGPADCQCLIRNKEAGPCFFTGVKTT